VSFSSGCRVWGRGKMNILMRLQGLSGPQGRERDLVPYYHGQGGGEDDGGEPCTLSEGHSGVEGRSCVGVSCFELREGVSVPFTFTALFKKGEWL